VAVASAGPYANLHLAPDREPRQHPTTQFFTGRMPFLPHNQQRQSTEGTTNLVIVKKYLMCGPTFRWSLALTARHLSAGTQPFGPHRTVPKYCFCLRVCVFSVV